MIQHGRHNQNRGAGSVTFRCGHLTSGDKEHLTPGEALYNNWIKGGASPQEIMDYHNFVAVHPEFKIR